MKHHWPTKEKDMQIASLVMEAYAEKQNTTCLGLFELVVNEEEKCMDFKLAQWVLVLAEQFHELYGANQGEQVTRLVISHCMVQEQTMH